MYVLAPQYQPLSLDNLLNQNSSSVEQDMSIKKFAEFDNEWIKAMEEKSKKEGEEFEKKLELKVKEKEKED